MFEFQTSADASISLSHDKQLVRDWSVLKKTPVDVWVVDLGDSDVCDSEGWSYAFVFTAFASGGVLSQLQSNHARPRYDFAVLYRIRGGGRGGNVL